jgi:hypothetical protein
MQVNSRIKVDYPGSNIAENTDLLVPIFWIEQYDSAKDHQVNTIKELQKNMKLLLTIDKLLLPLGLGFIVLAVAVLFYRWRKLRHHERGLLERQGTGDSSVSAARV